MNRVNMFKLLRSGRFSGVVALVGLGLLFTASGAKAGCAPVPYKAAGAPSIPFVSPEADGKSLDHQEGEERDRPTIVGLWHLIYTAKFAPPPPAFPPTPFQFLESFKTWHADGTEFENAFLPPAGGNICFGVWKDLDDGSVKLHHIGLLFGPDGSLSAIFTVDETDTVASDGKTYKGMFDFKLWPPSYDAVGVGAPIAEVKGTTAATRITVD